MPSQHIADNITHRDMCTWLLQNPYPPLVCSVERLVEQNQDTTFYTIIKYKVWTNWVNAITQEIPILFFHPKIPHLGVQLKLEKHMHHIYLLMRFLAAEPYPPFTVKITVYSENPHCIKSSQSTYINPKPILDFDNPIEAWKLTSQMHLAVTEAQAMEFRNTIFLYKLQLSFND